MANQYLDRTTGRRIAVCMNCREEAEIVSYGLCQKCNMRLRRDEQRWVDPHGVPERLRKARKKLRTAYAKFLNLGEDLGFSDDEIEALKEMTRPHLAKIEATLVRELGDIEPGDSGPTDEGEGGAGCGQENETES